MMRREADVLRFIAATLNYFFERRERFAFTPVHSPDREDGRCGANGKGKILKYSEQTIRPGIKAFVSGSQNIICSTFLLSSPPG